MHDADFHAGRRLIHAHAMHIGQLTRPRRRLEFVRYEIHDPQHLHGFLSNLIGSACLQAKSRV
ncbi:hypothetical protein [Afipia birgiae]|jgi:hypothetical protein|uniref:hypothetical protein n=1 Tax=Afipia birgiae TaxID=151414 RepID=UPI0003151DCF|nr:hypothetical protein [Afipia birgiae]MBX9820566.1 hypothetical protein [Afipia birgiae]